MYEISVKFHDFQKNCSHLICVFDKTKTYETIYLDERLKTYVEKQRVPENEVVILSKEHISSVEEIKYKNKYSVLYLSNEMLRFIDLGEISPYEMAVIIIPREQLLGSSSTGMDLIQMVFYRFIIIIGFIVWIAWLSSQKS